MMRGCLAGALAVVLLMSGVVRAQSLVDGNLRLETWVSGLQRPTGVAFLPGGSGDAFVIHKNSGRVELIRERAVHSRVLNLRVANDSERGLLGIALHPRFERNGYVYLYYTAAEHDGGEAIDNRIERYRWNGSRLRFDRNIKTLPGGPGPNHDGGKIIFGPDRKLYAVIGDLNRNERTENFASSQALGLHGVILRLNPNGSSPQDNPFFSKSNRGGRAALNDIYAYGVRNSFGIAFDSISGTLWDTENGPAQFDEINRVRPGFNSGWEQIMGPRSRSGGSLEDLVELGPAAHYADPVLSWQRPVAPTDLLFNNSGILGKEYRRDLLVGDVRGTLYAFDVTKKRRGLVLRDDLTDGVIDPGDDRSDVVLGTGFGIITDIEPGPGGIFITSMTDGTLYRISRGDDQIARRILVPEPAGLLIAATAVGLMGGRRRAPGATQAGRGWRARDGWGGTRRTGDGWT